MFPVRPEPAEGPPATSSAYRPAPPQPSFPPQTRRSRAGGNLTFLNKHPQRTHPTPPSFPLSREPRAGARRGGVSVSRRPCHPKLVIPAPTLASFLRRQEFRRAQGGATPPKPTVVEPQTPTQCVGAFREWPVPPQRDPHSSITASTYRPAPPPPSFPPHPVVPAQAGTSPSSTNTLNEPTQPHRHSREGTNPERWRDVLRSP